jgi:hypothetical protein
VEPLKRTTDRYYFLKGGYKYTHKNSLVLGEFMLSVRPLSSSLTNIKELKDYLEIKARYREKYGEIREQYVGVSVKESMVRVDKSTNKEVATYVGNFSRGDKLITLEMNYGIQKLKTIDASVDLDKIFYYHCAKSSNFTCHLGKGKYLNAAFSKIICYSCIDDFIEVKKILMEKVFKEEKYSTAQNKLKWFHLYMYAYNGDRKITMAKVRKYCYRITKTIKNSKEPRARVSMMLSDDEKTLKTIDELEREAKRIEEERIREKIEAERKMKEKLEEERLEKERLEKEQNTSHLLFEEVFMMDKPGVIPVFLPKLVLKDVDFKKVPSKYKKKSDIFKKIYLSDKDYFDYCSDHIDKIPFFEVWSEGYALKDNRFYYTNPEYFYKPKPVDHFFYPPWTEFGIFQDNYAVYLIEKTRQLGDMKKLEGLSFDWKTMITKAEVIESEMRKYEKSIVKPVIIKPAHRDTGARVSPLDAYFLKVEENEKLAKAALDEKKPLAGKNMESTKSTIINPAPDVIKVDVEKAKFLRSLEMIESKIKAGEVYWNVDGESHKNFEDRACNHLKALFGSNKVLLEYVDICRKEGKYV